jgi:hypothetical protein
MIEEQIGRSNGLLVLPAKRAGATKELFCDCTREPIEAHVYRNGGYLLTNSLVSPRQSVLTCAVIRTLLSPVDP